MEKKINSNLKWRSIGPFRGGRSVAVVGHPVNKSEFYFGACSGGVWKTTDSGTYWTNISDGFFNSSSIGAIAISQSDPNVIYVGTGESCIRGNVCAGDGVYKSVDGGNNWVNIGLSDTKFISRIRIHPSNPNLVYVAALGNIFGPNQHRGVYTTKDGGNTWTQSLYQNEQTGAADLSSTTLNPDFLCASMWDVKRNPWMLSSGGTGSGIFISSDKGDSWTNISSNKGLPKGILGRIGTTISNTNPNIIWALIESEKDRGLYRSDNYGKSWDLINTSPDLLQRPWYYGHIFSDPNNQNTLWVLNLETWKSTDGGLTFNAIPTPHGDNHDLWIDPNDTNRIIMGNDGGACVSQNGAETWSTIYNQPTAQFYNIATDNEFPYRIYATQQDNSAISTPSQSPSNGAILPSESEFVGSSESGTIAIDPTNHNIIYSGGIGSAPGGGDQLHRYDKSIGQTQVVSIWPELDSGKGLKNHKYRFQWSYPIIFSPHDSNTLYVGAEKIFKSTNGGENWKIISPDLTRNDVTKMEPSGGLTPDNTYVEHYGTILSLTESPISKGLFWVGSDDGLIHISHDNSKTWENITPRNIPKNLTITKIEASPFNASTAYISGHNYRLNDNKPYLYKTTNAGKSWKKITKGLPENQHTWTIISDIENVGLLFAATEAGVYTSYDDGNNWHCIKNNLPTVPVRNLTIKRNDLIAATHGRSFWILDNIELLRQIQSTLAKKTKINHLFQPYDTYRIAYQMDAGRSKGPGIFYMLRLGAAATWKENKIGNNQIKQNFLDAGENPIYGTHVFFYIDQTPEKSASLTFLDSKGVLISAFKTNSNKEDSLKISEGMNHFVWNMRYPDSNEAIINKKVLSEKSIGPLATPGKYSVTLEIDGETFRQSFNLITDPRIKTKQSDFVSQFNLLIDIRNKISETHSAIVKAEKIIDQINQWKNKIDINSNKELLTQADKVQSKISAITSNLIQPGGESPEKWILPTSLISKLKELPSVINNSDTKPTKQSYEVFTSFCEKIDTNISRLNKVILTDVKKFTDMLAKENIPLIDIHQK
tara:strand:+ start:2988 stop:6131 length:3144 start_codon:yes stop_codon:yes gene_type:complete